MRFFGFGLPHHCLDEGFDDPDAEADRELCRAIVAGRYGLHPEAWGGQSSLTAVMPLGFPGYEPPLPQAAPLAPYERVYHPSPADLREAELLRGPKPKPKREPPAKWVIAPEPEVDDKHGGTIQLSCDDCGAKFSVLSTYDHGQRGIRAAQLRELGRDKGWTRIVGHDRCPACSFIGGNNALRSADVADGADGHRHDGPAAG